MKKNIHCPLILCICFALLLPSLSYSQVAVNITGDPPDSSAMLEVSSTSKGVLLPRMTTAQRNAIPSPAEGLMIFNTDKKMMEFRVSGAWRQMNVLPSGQAACGTDFSDLRDQKIYPTVIIGSRCWMASNLDYGVLIDSAQTPADNGVIEKYSYRNRPDSANLYGSLYSWYEMMQYGFSPGIRGICPDGWHLPEKAEWDTLLTFLGGTSVTGGKMKETGTRFWNTPNTGAGNESGFSARGAGKLDTTGVAFTGIREFAGFWSSSSSIPDSLAWGFALSHTTPSCDSIPLPKTQSLSVRCVKNP